MSEPRVMPQSEEAEIAVLGSILLNPEHALDVAMELLNGDHFYKRSHRIIFEAIRQLQQLSVPIDTISVTERLKSSGTLKEVGDAFYISKLPSLAVTSAHTEYYAKVLREKFQLRRIIEVSTRAIEAAYESPESVDGLLAQVQDSLLKVGETKQDENLVADCHQKLLEKIQRIGQGKLSGIESGIGVLDNFLGGLVDGRMISIVAEAGCGKTSLFEQILCHILPQGNPALVLQKDMSAEDWYSRMACRVVGVSLFRFERGFCSAQELEKIAEGSHLIRTWPLILVSPSRITGKDLRLLVKREKRKHGIKAVFVDHMRTLSHNCQKQWEGITQNSQDIRDSANETKIPHVVLNHVNREGRKSGDRPTANNIKGCDQLLDDSDTVIMLWPKEERPEHIKGVDQKWEIGFAFDKNRGGVHGEDSMIFNGTRMTFEPISKS